jgi:hypothetical protein
MTDLVGFAVQCLLCWRLCKDVGNGTHFALFFSLSLSFFFYFAREELGRVKAQKIDIIGILRIYNTKIGKAGHQLRTRERSAESMSWIFCCVLDDPSFASSFSMDTVASHIAIWHSTSFALISSPIAANGTKHYWNLTGWCRSRQIGGNVGSKSGYSLD